MGLQNKVRKKNEKRRGHRNKKRRQGGSAPLGVITNDNNVITRTLSKKIKKTTENMADLNTKFFLNLLLWVDRTLGYPPFGAKGK